MIQETVTDHPTASAAPEIPGLDQPLEDLLGLLPPRLVAALAIRGFIRVGDLVSPHRQVELLTSLASWQTQQLREALEIWPLQYAQDLRDLGPVPEDLDWYEDWDGEDDWDFLAEEDEEESGAVEEEDDEGDAPDLDRDECLKDRAPIPGPLPAVAV